MNVHSAVARPYAEPQPSAAAVSAGTPAATASAVSWGAILAGGTAAAALSLILLILGSGLGLSSVSPWSHAGVGATTLGVGTILWITLTQLLASGMGGYLSGRLRTRWAAVHVDEAHFRDTAHGFLAWAVASLATAALLTSVIGSIVSGAGAGAVAVAVAVTATPDQDAGSLDYAVDSLFRQGPRANFGGSSAGAALQGHAYPPGFARIFANALHTGSLPAADARYLGQEVTQRTGLSPPEAERRVRETYARLQATADETLLMAEVVADKARKASAYAALWMFISLLAGAFVASLAATYGGRQRDA